MRNSFVLETVFELCLVVLFLFGSIVGGAVVVGAVVVGGGAVVVVGGAVGGVVGGVVGGDGWLVWCWMKACLCCPCLS